jgi:TPP-dependent pyruvate/acetoin dehydrogenase alpha subunit
LGQGLSVAAGLACAARLDDVDKTIYCIIGDLSQRLAATDATLVLARRRGGVC